MPGGMLGGLSMCHCAYLEAALACTYGVSSARIHALTCAGSAPSPVAARARETPLRARAARGRRHAHA
eukprot:6662504-Alexandrium_andersonii.AAC.1